MVSSPLPHIAPGVEGTYKQDLAAIAKSSKFRINNSQDKYFPPLTPSEIRSRCNTIKPPYNGLTENCETFCLWARNNYYLSDQILALLSVLVAVHLTYCVFLPLLSNLLPTWLLPSAAHLVMHITWSIVRVSLENIVIHYKGSHNIILPATFILPALHLLYMYWMSPTNLPSLDISVLSLIAAVITVSTSLLGMIFIYTNKSGYSVVTASLLTTIVIPVITNMIVLAITNMIVRAIPTTIVTGTAVITIAMLYYYWVTMPGWDILYSCVSALPVMIYYQH